MQAYPAISQIFLLACGILASILKVATDLLAGIRWKGYSFVSQSISVLSAEGAPTRSLVLPLDVAYDVLMVAFAIGVWQLAAGNQLMRIAAALIAGNAVLSLLVILLLPMSIDQDGTPSATTVHVVLMATAMFFFLFAMGFGGAACQDWFRYYSFGTLLAYVLLAVARFALPSPATVGPPIATVGIQERTMVVGYLLWVVALAIHEASQMST